MKDKKALLLAEETLKIIIALISIGFLVYFLTMLYFNSVEGGKKLQAEETLEKVGGIINNPESISEDVTQITPSGWWLFSFTEEGKPNSCAGQSCICICKNILIDVYDRQIKQCSEKGACEIVPNLQSFEEIKIEKGGLTSIEITKSEDKIIIREKT